MTLEPVIEIATPEPPFPGTYCGLFKPFAPTAPAPPPPPAPPSPPGLEPPA